MGKEEHGISNAVCMDSFGVMQKCHWHEVGLGTSPVPQTESTNMVLQHFLPPIRALPVPRASSGTCGCGHGSDHCEMSCVRAVWSLTRDLPLPFLGSHI